MTTHHVHVGVLAATKHNVARVAAGNHRNPLTSIAKECQINLLLATVVVVSAASSHHSHSLHRGHPLQRARRPARSHHHVQLVTADTSPKRGRMRRCTCSMLTKPCFLASGRIPQHGLTKSHETSRGTLLASGRSHINSCCSRHGCVCGPCLVFLCAHTSIGFFNFKWYNRSKQTSPLLPVPPQQVPPLVLQVDRGAGLCKGTKHHDHHQQQHTLFFKVQTHNTTHKPRTENVYLLRIAFHLPTPNSATPSRSAFSSSSVHARLRCLGFGVDFDFALAAAAAWLPSSGATEKTACKAKGSNEGVHVMNMRSQRMMSSMSAHTECSDARRTVESGDDTRSSSSSSSVSSSDAGHCTWQAKRWRWGGKGKSRHTRATPNSSSSSSVPWWRVSGVR